MIHCLYTRLADPASLVPHPRNPNKHPDAQIALLANIIRQVGWRHPIVVSKRSGYIVSGHGRLAAALLLGCETVPVSDQDFDSPAIENATLLADNRIAELAMVDEGELKQLLSDLKLEDELDMTLTGFTEHEIEALLAGIDHLPDEPEKDKTEDSAAWLKLSKGAGGKTVKLDLTNDERDDFAACIREYAKVNGSSSGFLNYVVGILGKKENQIIV